MKSLHKILLIAGITLFCYSCQVKNPAFEKVLVLKGNQVFNSVPAGAPPMHHSTTVATVTKCYKTIVTTTDTYLTVADAPTNFTTSNVSGPITNTTMNDHITWKRNYFMRFNGSLNGTPKLRQSFYYMDIKPVFQTLTIPFKFRPKEFSFSQGVHDTALATYQTSVNVGFAGGFKFSLNRYVPHKNFFGTNTLKISFIPGFLLGLSGTELKADNTFPKVTKSRTALSITTGLYAMIGINSINFGYAYGCDFATGENRNKWIYQGRNWHGIIIAIDLIK